MDQLKIGLAWAKKHHFWVLSVVTVAVGLLIWAQATADLAEQYDQRKSTVDNHFHDQEDICAEAAHPNPEVIESIKLQTTALTRNVHEAWQYLYDKQKEKNRLPAGLSDEFKRAFEALGADDRLPDHLLEHYQYFIRDHFPLVFDIIDLRRPAEGEEDDEEASEGNGGNQGREIDQFSRNRSRPGRGARSRGQAPASDVEMVGIVDWDGAEELIDRFDWVTRPSTLQVKLAQEDLWVYEALLRVIANTNAGVTAHYKAPVKRIIAMEIGQQAAASWGGGGGGTGTQPGSGGGPAFGAPMPAGEYDEFSTPGGTAPDPMGMGPMDPSADPTAPAADPERQRLLADRYVDENGNPLGAEEEPPYAEFKMMPFRLHLVMDQTKVPVLLTWCANSNMPIEAKAVRLQPGAGAPLSFAAVSESGAGEVSTAPGGGFGGAGGNRNPGGRLPKRLPGDAMADSEYQPLDMPVEIQGVIYIYNKPDLAKVATGTASETPEEPGTPPEQPAAPPTQPETPETPETPAGPGTTPPGAPAGGGPTPPGTPTGPPAGVPTAPPGGTGTATGTGTGTGPGAGAAAPPGLPTQPPTPTPGTAPGGTP